MTRKIDNTQKSLDKVRKDEQEHKKAVDELQRGLKDIEKVCARVRVIACAGGRTSSVWRCN